MGNKHFPIAVSDIAAAITAFGRYNLKTLAKTGLDLHKEVTGKDTVITNYATDAIYIVLDEVVNKFFNNNKPDDKNIAKFLDSFNKKVFEPRINKNIEYNLDLHNGYVNCMGVDREVIASHGIVTGISRYSLRVIDDEGKLLDKPKQKTVGMPNINMTIPLKIRQALDKAVQLIFDKDNDALIDFLNDYKKEFVNYKPSEFSMKSGVSNIKKYEGQTKGVYWVSKASIAYNKLLEKYNLKNEFDTINENDKVMVVYLKKNPIVSESVLAFKEDLFLEKIGLNKYIDYDTHYDKLFLENIKTLTNTINWSTNKNSLLMDLF